MASEQVKARTMRLIQERKAFKYNLAKNVQFLDDTGSIWKFSIQCDSKTPYSKDKINIIFKIPQNYPFEEPEVWVQSPDRFMHPNINKDGKICYCGQQKPGSAFHMADRINMVKELLQKPNPKDAYVLQYAEKVLDNYNEWFAQSQKKFNQKKN